MQWSLFLFILMGSFFTCQLLEYSFIKQQKKWRDAKTYCKKNHKDLAKVYDMKDMKRLNNSRKNQKEAWIGLYKVNTRHIQWHWSLPGVDNKAAEEKWCHGQTSVGNNKSCVLFTKNNTEITNIQLYWTDTPCTEKHRFICYDEIDNSSKKFHLIEENKMWLDAQSYCRERHTDLVSGLNQLEDEELIREMGNNCNMYWVGLFRDTWRSDGGPFYFSHWYHSYLYTAIQQGKEKCAMLGETGRWKTANCEDEKYFICYDDKVILIKQNKTWAEALYYCRENHRDLVSITNSHQQRWVQEKAKKAKSPYVWLGLRYTCTLDFWFWVSDEVVYFKNWASDGQIDDCDMSGAMKSGGQHKWFSQRDNKKYNFICAL